MDECKPLPPGARPSRRVHTSSHPTGSRAAVPTAAPAGARPQRRLYIPSCPTGSRAPARTATPPGRGLHSFTFQINVSAFCGIGGASKGCLGAIEGVLWGVRGDKGPLWGEQDVFLFQKRLRLS